MSGPDSRVEPSYTIRLYEEGEWLGELLRGAKVSARRGGLGHERVITRQSMDYPNRSIPSMLAHFASIIGHEQARAKR